jgi:hypothetical protein
VRQLKEELATKDTKIKNMEKEKDKDASTSGEPAPKASARRGGRARDDGDGDVSKLQEKLKGKEDEVRVVRPRLHYRLLTLCPAPTDPVPALAVWPCGRACICVGVNMCESFAQCTVCTL